MRSCLSPRSVAAHDADPPLGEQHPQSWLSRAMLGAVLGSLACVVATPRWTQSIEALRRFFRAGIQFMRQRYAVTQSGV
jgi:hypothetical protein